MPVSPTSGHDTNIFIELNDGSGAVQNAGTFVKVASCNQDDISFGGNRAHTDAATARGDTIVSRIFSPVLAMDDITIEGLWIHDGTYANDTAGLMKHWLSGTEFGMNIRGPNYADGGPDDWICSGQITAYRQGHGKNENPAMFTATFTPTGKIKYDGTEIGTVGT